MRSEPQPLPISALQHLLFCERQCALIHIEGLWAENRLTVEGRHLHEKAHAGRDESHGRVRVARGLPLRSKRLGIWGYADVVEFHEDAAGKTVAFPIEYKRGRPRRNDADRVQLCAQALCLEESLDIAVPKGALFYGRTRRRLEVAFDAQLRKTTEDAASRLHDLLASEKTPIVRREKKCEQCSLLDLCLPDAAGKRRTASAYLDRSIESLLTGHVPADTAVSWASDAP